MLNNNFYDKDYYNKQQRTQFYDCIPYNSYVNYLYRLRQGVILDCGCGVGQFLCSAEKKYDITIGFDISYYAIKQSQKILTESQTWISSATCKFPLKNNTVDVVSAFDIVEHFIEHDIFFYEVSRVLKSNGIILIRTPNINSYTLKKKGNNWFGYRDSTHVSLRPLDYWISKMKAHKFQIIDFGTDLIWDTPFLKNIPNRLQKIIFKSSKLLLQLYRPFLNNLLGDNLIVIGQKQPN